MDRRRPCRRDEVHGARDETGALKRASLRSALPWVRSVIVCAINYNTAQPYSTEADDPRAGMDRTLRLGATRTITTR